MRILDKINLFKYYGLHRSELSLIIFILILFNTFETYSQYGWTQYNTGTTMSIQNIFFTDTLYGWATTASDTMFYTTNGGNNWIKNIIPTYGDFLRIQFLDRNTGWGSGPSGLIKMTTNGGLNWIDQSIQTSWLPGLFFINYITGWVSGNGGKIHKTLNSGYNWVQQISGYDNTLFSISMLNVNTGYIGMYNGNILKTTDSGNNWIEMQTGLNRRLYDIQFFNENTGFATGFYPGEGMVAKTINAGMNWFIQFIYQNYYLNRLYFINEQTGWVCGGFGAIFYTSNSGINWQMQPTGLTFVNIEDIHFATSTKGWAGVSQGIILKTTTGGLVPVNTNKENVIDDYKLYQNYPNPFNPVTIISYELPVKDLISIRLYEESGKLIKTIFNGIKEKGKYSVSINMSQYSSGVYFYSLETKKVILTKKIIYIK